MLLLFASIANGDTVLLFDDFNSENGGGFDQNYNRFSNWEVTRGAVDLIGNGNFDFFAGNGLYIDLDGSNLSGPGRIESSASIDLVAGMSYTLSFKLGNTDDSFGASAIVGLSQVDGLNRAILITSLIAFLLGVQLPTVRVNIPLNNHIQTLDVNQMSDQEVAHARAEFEDRWNRWNVVRTVIAIAIALSLHLLLLRL